MWLQRKIWHVFTSASELLLPFHGKKTQQKQEQKTSDWRKMQKEQESHYHEIIKHQTVEKIRQLTKNNCSWYHLTKASDNWQFRHPPFGETVNILKIQPLYQNLCNDISSIENLLNTSHCMLYVLCSSDILHEKSRPLLPYADIAQSFTGESARKVFFQPAGGSGEWSPRKF